MTSPDPLDAPAAPPPQPRTAPGDRRSETDAGDITARGRRGVAVIAARVVLLGAVLALAVTAVAPAVTGLTERVAILVITLPVAVATIVLLDARADRHREWPLLGLVLTSHGAVLVAGLVEAHDGRVTFLWLAVSLLLSSMVLRSAVHLVLTAATTVTAAVIVGLSSAAPAEDLLPVLAAGVVGGVAWLAVLVHRRTLYELQRERDRARRNSDALRAVVDAARTATTAEVDDVLGAIVDATVHLGSDSCAVFLIDDEDGTVSYAASRGIPEHFLDKRFPPDVDMIGACTRERRTLVTNDYDHYEHATDAFRNRGIRAAITSPIHIDDEIVGVLGAGNFGDRTYDASGIAAFELLADHAGRALALARAIGEDRAALASVRHLHQLQEDFVSTVSHELRTPITVIDGLAQTMQRLGPHLNGEQGQQLLERLTAHTHTLSSVVTSLLELARLDRGLAETAETPVQLGELARGSLARMRTVLAHHEVVAAVEDVTVLGDADLLERVLDNLLTNAARYTPPGTTVTVTVEALPDRARVTVADDGPGIPAHEVHRITERFRRGGSLMTRETRGLGLGLALAEQVLRHHGSRLRVHSEVGVGTEFSFDVSTRPRAEQLTTIDLVTDMEERHLRTRDALSRRED